MKIVEPKAPNVTSDDVISEEDRKTVAEYLGRKPQGKVQPTAETSHLTRRYQNRSKYNGDGSLRQKK